jgi:hypothetical protein
VPWCEPCGRFYTPSTLSSNGDCPAGHHVVDAAGVAPLPQSDAQGRDATAAAAEEKVKVPWHFWVLVAAVVAYLGWRLIQGVVWLAG